MTVHALRASDGSVAQLCDACLAIEYGDDTTEELNLPPLGGPACEVADDTDGGYRALQALLTLHWPAAVAARVRGFARADVHTSMFLLWRRGSMPVVSIEDDADVFQLLAHADWQLPC